MRLGWMGIAVLTLVTLAVASPRKQVKAGNQAAVQGQADAAMVHYKKALEQKGDSSVVLYDLGNLLYSGGDYDNASKTFMGSYDPKDPPAVQSQTFYNLGNSLFEGKKYDQAAEAYLESLKRNPKDDDARYNLELARRMLKQQQQQKQKQKQDQQKDDQKKDDQKKDDQKQDQQQQQDQKKDEQKQDQQQDQQAQQDQQQQDQHQQPMAGQQMSKEDAERLLNALLQNEQDALHDAKKVKVATRAKREKDW
jgi:Ca-activated chloride channel homolog